MIVSLHATVTRKAKKEEFNKDKTFAQRKIIAPQHATLFPHYNCTRKGAGINGNIVVESWILLK
ncbi:MAG TPA: hypothetical protein VKY45_08435 [Marinilabiliaceae bacterium]|nr:hypothetical protein [Marinilabiliaceae bacterium]